MGTLEEQHATPDADGPARTSRRRRVARLAAVLVGMSTMAGAGAVTSASAADWPESAPPPPGPAQTAPGDAAVVVPVGPATVTGTVEYRPQFAGTFVPGQTVRVAVSKNPGLNPGGRIATDAGSLTIQGGGTPGAYSYTAPQNQSLNLDRTPLGDFSGTFYWQMQAVTGCETYLTKYRPCSSPVRSFTVSAPAPAPAPAPTTGSAPGVGGSPAGVGGPRTSAITGGGNRSTAKGPLRSGRVYSAELYGEDWYRFHVRRTSKVRLRLFNDTTEPCTIISTCPLIAFIEGRGKPQSGALVDPDEHGFVTATLRPGTYYVRVAIAGVDEGDGQEYRFSVEGALSSKKPSAKSKKPKRRRR